MATSIEATTLRAELVAACRKQGFRTLTPIQALVVPQAMQGLDLIVEAKTGSGKTLAYGLPLLNSPFGQTHHPEVLIVTPTRELAEQVQASLSRTAGSLPLTVLALTGKGGLTQQLAALAKGVQIVVATVGRLEELLERKLLTLDFIRALVLDEVDELFEGGFSKNLAELIERLPASHQTLLFSASIPKTVETLAQQFMRKPKRLQLQAGRELVGGLTHQILRTAVKTRLDDLGEYLRVARPYQALIFCGTRHEAESVQTALREQALEAEFFHGDLSTAKRRRLIEAFRSGELPILVATDLVARGLDLPGVDVVINYSLPEDTVAYLHRAGRTGRAGKPGLVVTLLIEQQHQRLEHLKETLTFEKVEVHGTRVVVRPIKTREERDLEFRRQPLNAGPPDEESPARKATPPKRPTPSHPRRGRR